MLAPLRLLLAPALLFSSALAAEVLRSPDGKIAVEFELRAADGAPVYRVRRGDELILRDSRLGLVRNDADFTHGLTLLASSAVDRVEDHYELLTGKRRRNVYRAARQVHHLATATGAKLDLEFRVSDDGVAFRYVFPEKSAALRTIVEEATSFHLPADAKAWLQPMSVAKTGWKRTNPSYEEHYQREIPVGTPSTLGAGWVFPALFRTGDTWVALSETDVGPDYCGTRLRHESPDGDYRIGFPDPRETMHGRPVAPKSTLPWTTPWRLIALGSLATVAESTLGTDLAAPARTPPTAPEIQPGKAAWSWPLLGDGQTTYEVQKGFIDYAAAMGWAYCLIDSMWDQQIGDAKIQELAAYARTRHVGLLLWYNSNGDWNDAPQTPKDRLATPAARRAEFERLRALGIKGLKIDFFGGDGQPVMELYHDLLRDAEPYGFLLNFHGATLPRGWTRTYPHLMTAEAVKGFEFVTFAQENADAQPAHCALLPFTRNLFEPMDFTPLCLDRLPGRGVRRTTVPFELALAVLFTSGIQHYAEIPAGMAKMPDYVRAFLRQVPSIWDDTKLIDGYPGKFAVLARQGDGRWFVAGINGEATARPLDLDLTRLAAAGRGTVIVDDAHGGYESRRVAWPAGGRLPLTLAPHGGFVLVVDPAR
ncbi:glycoside hydrolase family 97 catalytic domain-containing protein [Oleiharenicola sp. Vm1]|uniref:glycoside hydrolase family 97 protein n=1 Tax=Oleiharenicola sp. Vm1 TaxID=3398393 RepID=UPI0039F4EFDA